MDLKDLNNQQLILLALLVSFITSIATGIVTVTLMDQAPPAVTQTINRIIEKTVTVVDTERGGTKEIITETIVVKEEDLIVKAVEKNTANVVEFGIVDGEGNFKSFGSGFAVSSEGVLATGSTFIDVNRHYTVRASNKELYGADLLTKNSEEGIALLKIVPREESVANKTTVPDSGAQARGVPQFSQVILANSDSIKIGQTVLALGGSEEAPLLLGVVSRIGKTTPTKSESTEASVDEFYTTISFDDTYSGGPLLDVNGYLIGINLKLSKGGYFTVPGNILKGLLVKESLSQTEGRGTTTEKQTAQVNGARP